ncbi:MAG TPA: zf-HC2 domain-containing protein [Mizugakiibacter sp.]
MLRFEGAAHLEAERLLPWYVNGTLEGEELARIEQHLTECARCQRELTWQRELQAACAGAEAAADAGPALQRLRERLDAEPGGGRRPLFGELRRGWKGSRPWLRWAVAAQFAAVAALAGALAFQGRPALYRTLGAADKPPRAAGDLVVVFDPGLDEAAMRRLLRASGARIVDGPTETGAYVLDVPDGHETGALEALRAARGVVLVERLNADGGK